MTQSRNRRLTQDELQTDRSALGGIQSLSDYAPLNSAYSAATLAKLGQAVEEAQQAEMRAQQVLTTLRDAAAAAEWALHEAILGAKSQVLAQYGLDSPAIQLLWLKRKSDRRRRTRLTIEAE
jgi:hypothetical protein